MSDAIRKYREANPLPAPTAPSPDFEQSPVVVASIAGQHNGWLSPVGEFYPCAAWEHEDHAWRLAERYGYVDFYSGSKALEENGWVKLKSGDWIVVLLQECTQRQLDA